MASNTCQNPFKREISDDSSLQHMKYFQEDPEKMIMFFHPNNSQYKSELQKPITTQGDSRLRHSLKRECIIPQQAHLCGHHIILNESSYNCESKHEHCNNPKENPKDQSQLVHPFQNQLDQLESLQFSLFGLKHNVRNQVNHFKFQEEYQVKIEEEEENHDIFQKQIQERGSHLEAKIYQQRRSIYTVMNKFRAFNVSTNACSNTIKLFRNLVNKIQSSILCILSKQNKRMVLELQKQKQRVEQMFEKPKSFNQRMRQAQSTGAKDDLLKTGIQDEEVCVKLEEIQKMECENIVKEEEK